MEGPRSGEDANDSEWTEHIDRLKQWTVISPTSVTARIALANAYLEYAWHARGSGYASSVRESDWQLFGERMQMAATTLVDADSLQEKCPEWFHSMMNVALGVGWSPEIAHGIVEKSREFEPAYYYPYRDLANFLLPKWYGEEGDSEKFATQIADKIGGKLGDAMYAEIAPSLYCGCANEPLGHMDFDRIARGYAADEELYGVSLEKLNKLAYIAIVTNHMDVAKKTFARLGDNWDKATWKVKRSFDVSKQHANGELPPAPAFDAVGRTSDK
jgi:hypothetical protein